MHGAVNPALAACRRTCNHIVQNRPRFFSSTCSLTRGCLFLCPLLEFVSLLIRSGEAPIQEAAPRASPGSTGKMAKNVVLKGCSDTTIPAEPASSGPFFVYELCYIQNTVAVGCWKNMAPASLPAEWRWLQFAPPCAIQLRPSSRFGRKDFWR